MSSRWFKQAKASLKCFWAVKTFNFEIIFQANLLTTEPAGYRL
jgi:hypothetical protein